MCYGGCPGEEGGGGGITVCVCMRFRGGGGGGGETSDIFSFAFLSGKLCGGNPFEVMLRRRAFL